MASMNILATMERLQKLGWLTTMQAAEYGVPDYMIYRWGERLEKKNWALKLPIPPRGLWLVSPDGMTFLRKRKGKVGRPREHQGQ